MSRRKVFSRLLSPMSIPSFSLSLLINYSPTNYVPQYQSLPFCMVATIKNKQAEGERQRGVEVAEDFWSKEGFFLTGNSVTDSSREQPWTDTEILTAHSIHAPFEAKNLENGWKLPSKETH